VLGYYFETILKMFEKKKNITLVSGAYHPIYGFGVAFAFAICTIPFNIFGKFAVISVGIILIEYLGGLIFNRWLGLKLWDYSDKPLNLQGQICLFVSIGWVLASAVFVFLLFPILKSFLSLKVCGLVLAISFSIVFIQDLVRHSVKKLR
jgi:uncharacterized membrane protein